MRRYTRLISYALSCVPLSACSSGSPTNPPPPPITIAWSSTNPQKLIADGTPQEFRISTNGLSCRVHGLSAQFVVAFLTPCSTLTISAAEGTPEGAYELQACASRAGTTERCVRAHVFVEREKVPLAAYAPISVVYGQEGIAIRPQQLVDVDTCSVELFTSRHNDALTPIPGEKCAYSYRTPEDTVTGGKRIFKVQAQNDQEGSVPATASIEINLTVPRARIDKSEGEIYSDGRASRTTIGANAPAYLRSTRVLFRAPNDDATPVDGVTLTYSSFTEGSAVIYFSGGCNSNIPPELWLSVSNNGVTWEATMPVRVNKICPAPNSLLAKGR